MEQGKAIIIVGVARSGTSSVAASINSLGVFLGEAWHEPIYEDLHLARYFREKNWKAFKNRIAHYENTHDLFAWKLPDVTEKLGKVHKFFKSPKYIFVFRDLFAISNRMNLALDKSYLEGMRSANKQYSKVLSFISKVKPEHLLLSYEKILTETDGYALQLLDFLDMEKSQKNIDTIKRVISPSPLKYREWSDNSRNNIQLKKRGLAGHLDHLDQTKVSGWAKSIENDQPISVDIYVNDNKAGSIVASDFREDLVNSAFSTTGYHGFTFSFTNLLKSRDEVSVKPINTEFNLIGSPRKID